MRNRREVTDDLVANLSEHGIEPIGNDVAPRSIHTDQRRVLAFSAPEEAEEAEEAEEIM